MMQHKIILTLAERLTHPLPGWEIQKKMSPLPSKNYKSHPIDAKQSAVLILISKNTNGQLFISYIKRTSRHHRDMHSGQISFPGGSKELSDTTLMTTALRECHEEVGVRIEEHEIIGAISPIYIKVSNFFVQPFVAYVDYPLSYVLQETEVDELIEVPLERLLEDDIVKKMDYKPRSLVIKNMPYYDLYPHVLWGATAMITAELLYLIKPSSTLSG